MHLATTLRRRSFMPLLVGYITSRRPAGTEARRRGRGAGIMSGTATGMMIGVTTGIVDGMMEE